MNALSVFVLCAVLAGAPSDPPAPVQTVVLQYEEVTPYSELPVYTNSMPDEIFIKWAKAQNEMAYLKARQRADEWRARHPSIDTFVQDNDYSSTSTLDQEESASSTGASVDATSNTRYNGTNIQWTYRQSSWGGGPVTIINPYVRPK